MKLVNWKAKRVGASMTISGQDAISGEAVKLTNVAAINAGNPSPTAAGYIKKMPMEVALGGVQERFN